MENLAEKIGTAVAVVYLPEPEEGRGAWRAYVVETSDAEHVKSLLLGKPLGTFGRTLNANDTRVELTMLNLELVQSIEASFNATRFMTLTEFEELMDRL